jgi:hypothetical protein
MITGVCFVVMGLIVAWAACQKKVLADTFIRPEVVTRTLTVLSAVALAVGMAAITIGSP